MSGVEAMVNGPMIFAYVGAIQRGNMSKIGYTINQAADAAGVAVRTVEVAVRNQDLKAQRIDGQPVILKADICEWLGTFPEWS